MIGGLSGYVSVATHAILATGACGRWGLSEQQLKTPFLVDPVDPLDAMEPPKNSKWLQVAVCLRYLVTNWVPVRLVDMLMTPARDPK